MIPLSKLYVDDQEMYEIRKVLESGWWADGRKNRELEHLVSDYLGVKHVICTSSCTTALHLAILGLNLNQGEILVSDFTFPASGHVVIHAGLKPTFVDVSAHDFNMNYLDLKRKINRNTVAIMVVHMFGQSADMDRIKEVSGGIPIIEDAAQALGAKYHGQFCGTIGEVGCFSLHATKSISTGEGGLLVTNNDTIADKVRNLMNFGRKDYHTFEIAGFNYKMSDIAAAIGVAQFHKLNKIIQKKNLIARYYNKKLNNIDWLTLPAQQEDCLHNFQSYCCIVSEKVDRNEIIRKMRDKGIECQIGTFSSFIQPCYDNKNDNCTVSKELYNRSLRLPIFYEMNSTDVNYVVEILKSLR